MASDSRAAWTDWARRQFFTEERAQAAAAAALDAFDQGADAWLAELAARAAAGEHVQAAAAARAAAIAAALDEVARLNDRPAAISDALARKLTLASALAGARPAPAAGTPAAVPAVSPRPSLRELAADNGVLLVGVTGAFLLVVATVLFELYGAGAYSGGARLAAVAALAAAFAVAGGFARGHDRFRTVGQVYIAVFALLFPLVLVAAYVFLELGGRGITVPEAVLATGATSCVLNAVLAQRLRAGAYSWLAVAWLAVAWGGAAALAPNPPWPGALFSLLAPAAALAAAATRRPVAWNRFRMPLLALVTAAAVVGVGWTGTTSCMSQCAAADYRAPAMAWSAIAAAYWIIARLESRRWLFAALPVSSAAVMFAARAVTDRPEALVLALAALAAAWVAAAEIMPSSWRWLTTIGAGVHLLASMVVAGSAAPHAVGLLVGAAALAVAARRQRKPVWAGTAAGAVALAWYWLGAWLLPPPAHPSADDLARLYVGLPFVIAAAGLVLARLAGGRWAPPVQVVAAAVAAVAAASALIESDYELAGWALLADAAAAYLVGVLSGWPYVAAAAVPVAAGGALALTESAGGGPGWRLLAAGFPALASYAAGEAYRRRGLPSAWVETHRRLGLAGVAVTTLAGLAAPAFYQRGSQDDLAAAGVALGLAALLALDSRLHGVPLLDYAAAVSVSLVPGWVAGFAGVTDPLAFTLAPGAAIAAAGAWLPFDRRLPRRRALDRAAVGAGLLIALGPECVAAAGDSGAWPHVVRLLAGGVLALVVAIPVRSRTLAVGGAVAAGLSALRALFLVLAAVQPYIVFGILALLLLVGAAALAGLRGRVTASGTGPPWANWN